MIKSKVAYQSNKIPYIYYQLKLILNDYKIPTINATTKTTDAAVNTNLEFPLIISNTETLNPSLKARMLICTGLI